MPACRGVLHIEMIEKKNSPEKAILLEPGNGVKHQLGSCSRRQRPRGCVDKELIAEAAEYSRDHSHRGIRASASCLRNCVAR